MNQIILIGNVVRDPKVFTLGSGKKVINFDIAVSKDYWSPAKHEMVKMPALFVKISCWMGPDYWDKILRKGLRVFVKGALDITKKDDKVWVSVVLNRAGEHELRAFINPPKLARDDEYELTEEEEEQIAVDVDDEAPF
jgi:hypothetical protein